MKRNRFLALLALTTIFLLPVCVAKARARSLTVTIVKGFAIAIPFPATIPSFKTPPEGGDVYSLHDQGAFFWEYRVYKTLDFNRDGRVDYYVVVQALFGPHAGDIDISVHWSKTELTPEEQAWVAKQGSIVAGGLPGRDYEPLFYKFAVQSLTHRGSTRLHKKSLKLNMSTGLILIRMFPDSGFSAVSYRQFIDLLEKNCRN